MFKKMVVVAFLVLVAGTICTKSYADEELASWKNVLGGIGGMVYNVLPWNWGNWAWK
jgi:hypothetical protein